MKNFRDLKVWETAHSFTLDSYTFTNALPRQELFGRTSQIRRAAVSIAANIAEGVVSAETENFSDV
jgi:four helix bundle protein